MTSIARLISDSLGDLPVDRHSCQLLGPTALVVQALMGILAVLSLVYKRHRETQKRPWKIWLFDVSKQLFGQMFVHGVNVLISDLGSYRSAGNACTYYFLNFLLDTTLGVGLIYVVLQSFTWLLSKKLGIKGLRTGQYGNPPSTSYWARQTAVYVFSIFLMKFLVVAFYASWPGLSSIGDWLLSWTKVGGDDSVQVIFVMGIFPMFMNIIQFWLIDSIVKASTTTASRSVSPCNSDSQDREPLFISSDDDDDDVPPRDIESGSRSATTSDSHTLVDTDVSKTKSPTTASPTPMTTKTQGVVAHNYPPDNIDGASSSLAARHKYRRSSLTLLDLPVSYSAPPTTGMLDLGRDSSRRALLSTSYTREAVAVDAVEFDAWEKDDWEERNGEGWSGRRSERNKIPVSAR